jgi:flagellar biosynthesis/type III secretory pathway M-ring protein FliF/YscJ
MRRSVGRMADTTTWIIVAVVVVVVVAIVVASIVVGASRRRHQREIDAITDVTDSEIGRVEREAPQTTEAALGDRSDILHRSRRRF